MASIEIINIERQHVKLENIKKIINDEWNTIDENGLDAIDKILKVKFDKIINCALIDNWINCNYVEQYINKTKNIIEEDKDNFIFKILVYTCLVDIFKYKIIKQNYFITNTIILTMCEKDVSKYKMCGELLLNNKIIEKINDIESVRNDNDHSTYINCIDLLEDMNFELPFEKLLNESITYLNKKLEQRKNDDKQIIFNINTSNKEIYQIIKKDIDSILEIKDNVFEHDIYEFH